MEELCERPYVVCHMVSSLDGRIDGEFFRREEMVPILEASNNIRERLNCDAVLYGAVTMAESYAEGYVDQLPKASERYPRTDYIASSEVESFYVSIDIEGRIQWSGKYIEKRGRKKSHVIEVLTENVSDDYISYLRTFDISYIFAGEEKLDCRLLLEKLKDKFHIQRVMLSGGGVVNWTFLQAGVIDELSLVLCPLTDGSRVTAALFDRSSYLPQGTPIAFTLENIQTLPGNGIWLVNKPVNVSVERGGTNYESED